jgi:hypothetical protein
MGKYKNYLICCSSSGIIYILNTIKHSIIKEIKLSKNETNISFVINEDIIYFTSFYFLILRWEYIFFLQIDR